VKLSPLTIVAIVFAVSFSGRAIGVAESPMKKPAKKEAVVAQAKAPEAPPLLMSATAVRPEAQVPASGEPAPKAAAATFGGAETERSALLMAIRERAASLDEREAKVMERERILAVVEKRIDEKTAALKAAKNELEGRVSFAETAAQEDIARLAKMYESMKPQKAGEIFNTMEPTFAAGFLTAMSNDGAALILANMNTEKAYAASVIIAGRNAAVNAP
jgi:flagellar motility protein MotE (MotC chaperone)